MSLRDVAVQSFCWKLLERGGSAMVQLLVQVVMARLLAPTQFGALAMMLVFVNLGNVVVQSGLNTALIQSPVVDSKDYSTVFWMSLVVSIILYICIFTAAPHVADYYAMPEIVGHLRIISLLLIVNAYNSVQIAKITRDLEMRKIFIGSLWSVFISAVIGIGSALIGFGLWALVFQQLAYQVVNCLVHAMQLDWRPSFEFSVKRSKELFTFGSKLLVSGLLETGYQSLSNLIIGKMFNPTTLGLVSQGQKYPQAIGGMIDSAVQPVMLSTVSKVQDDKPYVKRLVRRALKTSTFLMAPAMVLFATVAPTLIPAVLGEQWGPCVPYLQIYCLVFALLPIHSTNLQALNGVGRSDVFLKLEVLKKVIGVSVLMFCAFVLKNVYALVLSYLFTGIIATFINAAPNKSIIGYGYLEQVKDIAPSITIALLCGVVLSPMNSLAIPVLFRLALQGAIFFLLYFGIARVLRLEQLDYIIAVINELFNHRRK